MEIRAEEITKIIREQLGGFSAGVDVHSARVRTVEGEAVDRFELTDAADRPAVTLSGGLRRRLDLAMTLVSDPHIIFLDEPTTGLDPRSRRVLWQAVRDLVASGVTMLSGPPASCWQ